MSKKEDIKMVEVYMVAGSVRYVFATFNSEMEAVEFCDHNDWEWYDENCFRWSLEIED